MKRKALLSAVLSLILSFGTYFFEFTEKITGRESSSGSFLFDLEQRGFPFSFFEKSTYVGGQDIAIPTESSFDLLAIFGNWISWFVFIFLALFIVEWLAGFVGKMIIRFVIGLAVAAYGLFLTLG